MYYWGYSGMDRIDRKENNTTFSDILREQAPILTPETLETQLIVSRRIVGRGPNLSVVQTLIYGPSVWPSVAEYRGVTHGVVYSYGYRSGLQRKGIYTLLLYISSWLNVWFSALPWVTNMQASWLCTGVARSRLGPIPQGSKWRWNRRSIAQTASAGRYNEQHGDES